MSPAKLRTFVRLSVMPLVAGILQCASPAEKAPGPGAAGNVSEGPTMPNTSAAKPNQTSNFGTTTGSATSGTGPGIVAPNSAPAEPKKDSTFYVFLQNVVASRISIDGVQATIDGNSLILTDDANACTHSASQRVLSGSTTIQIFDPNFLVAANGMNISAGLKDGNNTLLYAWQANNIAEDLNYVLCDEPGFQGVDAGASTFTVEGNGMVKVTLPEALDIHPVQAHLSQCATGIVAPAGLTGSPGHQPLVPVRCVPQ
jgi:hypothetical protein